LDRTRDLQYHYDLARELAFLRKRGVLIIGSGNIVHNLQYAFIDPEKPPYDWAIEFDALSTKAMDERDHYALINYNKLGKSAELSVNSAEHYIPLLYTLALQGENETLTYSNTDFQFRAGSMRCVKVG
ncbi:MAG: 4,5-DOPA dioxygenase extradiol, partial [Flavobacteriales bacterium]|nr:4,5-DOPA dioxygenase extradiol [Flavobacteriales bacterium]